MIFCLIPTNNSLESHLFKTFGLNLPIKYNGEREKKNLEVSFVSRILIKINL